MLKPIHLVMYLFNQQHSLKNHSSLFKKEMREIIDIVPTKAVMDQEMSMLIVLSLFNYTYCPLAKKTKH